MTSRVAHGIRYRMRHRFGRLTHIGYVLTTAGRNRTTTQTVVGLSLIGIGLARQRSKRRKPVYTTKLADGETVRIRAYIGGVPAGESVVSG